MARAKRIEKSPEDERAFAGVAMRIDPETELRLDRAALAKSTPTHRVKRAAVARDALLRGLDAIEAEIAGR